MFAVMADHSASLRLPASESTDGATSTSATTGAKRGRQHLNAIHSRTQCHDREPRCPLSCSSPSMPQKCGAVFPSLFGSASYQFFEKARFIDFMFTFCDTVPQNAALALKLPLLALCRICSVSAQTACRHSDVLWLAQISCHQDSTLALALGLPLFACKKLLLSDLCSALGFFFLFLRGITLSKIHQPKGGLLQCGPVK